MGQQLFTNNASTTLASALGIGVTSMAVTSGSGSLFPVIASGSGDWFVATLQHISSGAVTAYEIVQVTATSTDTFTIVRAQENTDDQAWAAGDTVALLPTAGGLSNFAQRITVGTVLAASNMSAVTLGSDTQILSVPIVNGAVYEVEIYVNVTATKGSSGNIDLNCSLDAGSFTFSGNGAQIFVLSDGTLSAQYTDMFTDSINVTSGTYQCILQGTFSATGASVLNFTGTTSGTGEGTVNAGASIRLIQVG